MARRQRWCSRVGPATAIVPCGGSQHRVTWKRGRLILEDHHLATEQDLVSLGGTPCPCLRVLRMWRDQWKLPPELFRQMGTWLGANNFLAPAELAQPRELAMAVNWQRAWRASSFTGKHGLLLQDELRKAALEPLSRWASRWAERLSITTAPRLGCRLAPPGQPPALTGTVQGSTLAVTAALDVDWLLTVASRELALVGDAFVLEVPAPSPGDRGRRVRVARWGQPAAHGGGPVTSGPVTSGPVTSGPVTSWAWLGRTPDGTWALRDRGPRPQSGAGTAPAVDRPRIHD